MSIQYVHVYSIDNIMWCICAHGLRLGWWIDLPPFNCILLFSMDVFITMLKFLLVFAFQQSKNPRMMLKASAEIASMRKRMATLIHTVCNAWASESCSTKRLSGVWLTATVFVITFRSVGVIFMINTCTYCKIPWVANNFKCDDAWILLVITPELVVSANQDEIMYK